MSETCILNVDPSLAHNLKGHKKPLTDLAFHPDCKQLASSSLDNSVMLWNLSSKHKRCYNFMGHTDSVTGVEFSRDGEILASCSQDKTIRLWVPSIRGGSSDIKAHTAAVRSVSFSPENDKIITGSNDKTVKVWDLQRRKFLSSFCGHTNWVRCVKYSPDGKLIASCSDDRTLRIWDVNSGQCVHVFTCGKGSGNYVAVHANCTSIAVAMSSGSVRLYDIRTYKVKQHYILHDNTTCVNWHPHANYLLTSGQDGTIKVVDVMEGRPLYTLQGHNGGIQSVKCTNEGDQFASAGSDRTIMIWNTNFIVRNSPPVSASSTSSES